eukprot:1306274-Rhodomonas_salina.6
MQSASSRTMSLNGGHGCVELSRPKVSGVASRETSRRGDETGGGGRIYARNTVGIDRGDMETVRRTTRCPQMIGNE